MKRKTKFQKIINKKWPKEMNQYLIRRTSNNKKGKKKQRKIDLKNPKNLN